MQELLQKLRDIDLKINTLGEQYAMLKQQNKELKQENQSLKQDLDKISQDNEALIRELESAKSQMVHLRHQDMENEEVRKMLGMYIREVDKCMNLMQDVS